MSRWKAAGIHLVISLIFGLALFALIYFVLYPVPLFRAMGGSELAILVIAVDVVIGPLLTLAVFKSGKKSLKFDLTTIAVLQFGAMIYGLSILWLSRPVFIVARDDIAFVVAAMDISTEDLAKGHEAAFQKLPWTGPVVARLKRPEPGAEASRLLQLTLDTGKDIQRMPEFYRQWSDLPADLLEKSEPLADLHHRKPAHRPRIEQWLQKHGRQLEDVRYLTLVAFHEELCLAIDARTGAYLGIIDADPS